MEEQGVSRKLTPKDFSRAIERLGPLSAKWPHRWPLAENTRLRIARELYAVWVAHVFDQKAREEVYGALREVVLMKSVHVYDCDCWYSFRSVCDDIAYVRTVFAHSIFRRDARLTFLYEQLDQALSLPSGSAASDSAPEVSLDRSNVSIGTDVEPLVRRITESEDRGSSVLEEYSLTSVGFGQASGSTPELILAGPSEIAGVPRKMCCVQRASVVGG